MASGKRLTKITEALNQLNKDDIYSLMLFTLYKMKDIPDYLTLIELAYILDGDTLSKFLKYFGGMTLAIPPKEQFELVVQALYLYQYVNLEGGDIEDGLKAVLTNDVDREEVKALYAKIIEVLTDYEFNIKR